MKITNQFNKVLNYFRTPEKTAGMAKERLRIVIAHERCERDRPDYFSSMQRDLIDVIAKYVTINKDDIKMDLQRKEGFSILELNITLPT